MFGSRGGVSAPLIGSVYGTMLNSTMDNAQEPEAVDGQPPAEAVLEKPIVKTDPAFKNIGNFKSGALVEVVVKNTTPFC